MLSKRKRLGIILSFILFGCVCFTIGTVYSNGGNPTIDPTSGEGLSGFSWYNASIGVYAPEFYHEVLGNYTAWVMSIEGGGGVTDHGALTGLGDDDHNLYLLQDGSEGLTGNWDIGNYDLTAKYMTADEFYHTFLGNYTAWVESQSGGGITDHGALTGLNDDDHSLYFLEDGSETLGSELNAPGVDVNWIDLGGSNRTTWPSSGVNDHGALTGLNDDDHSLYLLQDGSEVADGIQTYWIDLDGDNRTTWPSPGSVDNSYGAWTYLIMKIGSYWVAIDEVGNIDYNTTSPTTTIQNAVNSITTGLIFIKDPGSTIVLTSDIDVNGKRISFKSDWATIQSASGEYAFTFENSHGFSSGNPYGGLEGFFINGNSRSGNGLLIDDVQGGLFEDLIFSGCNIGIKLTLSSDFSEGNTIEHIAILSPNYGIIFEGAAGGTGSFMDSSVRDIRINLDITGSTGIFFDAANGNVKPHNSRFENIHMWLKADYTCGMNFSDNGVTVQLWDTGFFDLCFELYTTGTEYCTGIYVGNDVNVDKYPYWLPMPRFINTDGADWTHVSNVRIDNSNNICLGTATEKYGQVNWTPDGTKIYRFYADNTGIYASYDISGSYD